MSTDIGNGIVESTFPTGSLVPKAETNVLNFLQKYPEFDGRDVTIAIFDSGVDPRATGLETLCDGKTVKVIERFDCSGSGDVDTSKKVTENNGYITGLSGRQLKLTPDMISTNTANGEYHVGMKHFNDTCPKSVLENRINAIKTKHWDGPNKTAIADVLRKINEFESQNTDSSKLTWDKKIIKDNLDYTLEMLNNYEKMYTDIKTSYDCIVYPTEEGWQTVIDTTEKGDLENAIHIGEYSKTHETKNIDDYLSVSVNIHDEGNVLEVVGMCSPHGTHVASIAGGNHASRDVDGVAPNAKIVSLTIGDGRLGSMETGTALVRAMMKIMELCREGRKVDVINMSYGEHAHWSNSGRVCELMSEIVNKYGVVWVASAGNHGPALCTVGTPPDMSQTSLIGVGAYVSPQMMEAEYAMRERLPANVFTWTSRDPCIDGGQGVTICAPGAAITSVPHFSMCKSRHMNGTSMAAPHAAGAIALLISGLKQKGIAYSPYSIKRAISVTATKLGYIDEFAQGNGLLNVEKAFEHLVEHANASENMLKFGVHVGVQNAKGIHLREGVLQRPYEFNVDIEPIFLNDKDADPADKINFNVRLNLVPSHPFVQCGAFLDLCYSTRSLVVKVNPVGLPPGVHTAVIRAFDSNCVAKGSLFDIPVTIVQPYVLNDNNSNIFEPISLKPDGSVEFQPNTIQRNFIFVPKGATWAVLRMRSTDLNRNKDIGRFFVHTMQILPKKSCRSREMQKIISVNSDTDSTCAFTVKEQNILELCIAKYWSNYGTTHLKYSLEFHGIKATNSSQMLASGGIHTMNIKALGVEEILPQIQLKSAAIALKPNESKISPLTAPRDVIPEGRQIYQNVLTYSFNVTKGADVSLYVPLFNSVLYESEFESQLWMLFDCNKSLVVCGDAHSNKFYTKLEKGDYTVKLQIRHEKRDFLEKISESNMLVIYKLNNTLTLDIYDHFNQCIVSGRKFVSCILKENQPKVLYIAPLPQEKLNKANLPANCAWLSGSIVLPKDDIGRRVDSTDFKYILSPTESSKKNGNNGSSSANNNSATGNANQKAKVTVPAATVIVPTATVAAGGDGQTTVPVVISNISASMTSPKKKLTADEYNEGLRDFQCSMITKCETEKAEKIYNEVIAANPTHLPAHLLLIQNIETNTLKPQYPITFLKSLQTTDSDSNDDKIQKEEKIRAILQRIIQLADNVLKDVNKNNLLAYYGMKTDTRPDAAKIKTNMDKQKSNLLEALVRKGIALVKLSILNGDDKEKTIEELDSIYTEMIKFSDLSDIKIAHFLLFHAYVHNHYGRMFKALQKMYEDKRNRECFEELAHIADSLNYHHLQTVIQRLTISAFPNAYRPF